MMGTWVDEVPDEAPHLMVCDSEDWSALYVDGRLDSVGDTYRIEERIRQLAGVVTLQSDDFMRGGNTRNDAAQTLEELRRYQELRQSRLRQAAELQKRAAELLQEAEDLKATR